ncbi:MAG: zf-HC2 domain-containing protein, partial [Acidobacteriota bacterium]|nr:zf-HC2 domain-containing protein [Acidobacteriota bacterium]
MTHDDVRDSAAAYLLGALEPHERAAIASHLEGCAPCRAALADEARALD